MTRSPRSARPEGRNRRSAAPPPGRRKSRLLHRAAPVIVAMGMFSLANSGSTTTEAAPAGPGAAGVRVSPAAISEASSVPSSGCGNSESRTASSTANVTTSFGGLQRSYLLTLPAVTSTPSSPDAVPLVLDFPGLGETDVEEALYSRLGLTAATEDGWIGITPEASGSVPQWTISPLPGPDDVGFIASIIASVESHYCVNTARVYAAGISNGAAFAGEIACDPQSRVQLAAVALVDGINTDASCATKPPLPMVAFNGALDPIVPFCGGALFGGANPPISLPATCGPATGFVPPAPTSYGAWAQRNGCIGSPTTAAVTSTVDLLSYSGSCAATELYVIEDGGHTWAGGSPALKSVLGPTDDSVSATALILQFFNSSE